MIALDKILALLTGTKVYDDVTGLWRVYDEDGFEIADTSGVFLRGLHGLLLSGHVDHESVAYSPSLGSGSVGGDTRRRVSKRFDDDDDVLLVLLL
jgi:hypothetical protein